MRDDVQQALLRDILDSAQAIQRYLAGLDYAAFLANIEKQDAVLRRFEIIGEAAGRLNAETRAQLPGLPFRSMIGMRNIIIHNYGEVDLDLVWQTSTNDLPALIEALVTNLQGNDAKSQ